jgi:hypothetical protein
MDLPVNIPLHPRVNRRKSAQKDWAEKRGKLFQVVDTFPGKKKHSQAFKKDFYVLKSSLEIPVRICTLLQLDCCIAQLFERIMFQILPEQQFRKIIVTYSFCIRKSPGRNSRRR